MDNLQAFHDALSEAIPARSENLEKTAIPALRENIQSFQSGVSSMYDFLIEKGLLQKDLYKSERTVTEIQVPSSDSIPETDVPEEVSQRFSVYVSQWEFLVNIFHVSINNLTLRKIKRLNDLLDWIRWTDFSPNSSMQITRAVANVVARVSKMNDPMAGKIMSSTAAHLRDRTYAIRKDLKILSEYLREAYKWKVRDEVMKGITVDPARYAKTADTVRDNIKFELTHSFRKMGWYKELVNELLEEDYGTDAAGLRDNVLNRLKVVEERKKKKTRKGPDDTTLLMGVIEKLARCGEPVRSALVKMNDNSKTIQERKKSFGERLSELFSNIFSHADNGVVYDITIKDAVTGAVKHESLDFSRFSAVAMKRAVTLQELQTAGSATYTNARAAGAEKLESYISRFLTEVKGIHRRLDGLDAYFKSDNIPREIQSTMKPCSLNIKNLKASIAETIKAFNEYKTRKEEQEQLAKLGIED